jgi:hypothetical protein
MVERKQGRDTGARPPTLPSLSAAIPMPGRIRHEVELPVRFGC